MKAIWLTHAHIDHAGATGTLARTHQGPSWARTLETSSGSTACPSKRRCSAFHKRNPSSPRSGWKDGDEVQIGHCTLQVIHCRATPGHVVFYDAAGRHAYVGDVLFAGSIGRTDFPGATMQT